MEEKIEEQDIGPKLSFGTFILKILAGGGGGAIGTLVLVVIFIFAQSILTPLTDGQNFDGRISPIFVFIMLMMTFLASTAGNILSTFFMALTEREKYKRLSTAIYQVFIISVIIFLLMVPVYFVAASINVSIIGYAVTLHLIISAQVSALILEIVSNYKYALVGVYGVTFAILISAGVLIGLGKVVESPTILLFASLPVVWGSIAFTGGLTTMIYSGIAKAYDKDFLSTQTMYGNDYGKEVADEEEEKAPVAVDEAGAEFLKKR